MYHVRLGEGHREEIVDVDREALEAGLLPHKPVDVDEKQGPPPISARLGWSKGLG